MSLAPIVLFAYNRPNYLLKTLESLALNELAGQTNLIIFADGPKPNSLPSELEKIVKTRQLARSYKGCKKVEIIERPTNWGLAKSVIAGVSQVVKQHQKVIVLEDDLVLSPFFLQYMNDALDTYSDSEQVLSIGACNFFASGSHISDTFFIPIPDCWGWATWYNRWRLFEPDAGKLLQKLTERNLLPEFNLHGAYDFVGMLKSQAEGKNNSWAIRWQAVSYVESKLNLYPKFSVAEHTGSDQNATNSHGFELPNKTSLATAPIIVRQQAIRVDPRIMSTMIKSYRTTFRHTSHLSNGMGMRRCIKKLVPPVFIDLYRKFNTASYDGGKEMSLHNPHPQTDLYWAGNYTTWGQAQAESLGYDAPLILEQVKQAVLKVKNGEAIYERDSVLFDKIQYSWPLLAILLKIASENNGRLSVLDFGGSLGSSYFQNRGFLEALSALEWSIVEQRVFVDCGQKEIADERLQFYYTVEECLQHRQPNVLVLSGVIQCLDAPYQWLNQFLQHRFPNIILDRTAFWDQPDDRLTIQHVPPSIYHASYPAWFLSREKVIAAIANRYTFVTDFDNGFTPPYKLADGAVGYWGGMYFTLK
jgi:putative methyltransferase (TIGR04325 family)